MFCQLRQSRPDGGAQGQAVQATGQGGSDRGSLRDAVGCLAPGRLGPNFPLLLAVCWGLRIWEVN